METHQSGEFQIQNQALQYSLVFINEDMKSKQVFYKLEVAWTTLSSPKTG